MGGFVSSFLVHFRQFVSFFYYITRSDDPVRVIPGLDFFYNPLAYIPADAKCIKFLIGGFTTACIDDAYKFPESDGKPLISLLTSLLLK